MITAWDDRASTADTDQHNDTGLCSGCGEFYTTREWESFKKWQDPCADKTLCRDCTCDREDEREAEDGFSQRAWEDHLQEMADRAAEGDDY